MNTLTGHWWTDTGWFEGTCIFDNRVVELAAGNVASDAPWFIPAPVDLHIHGNGGYDCMHGEAALRGMLKSTLVNGSGALLATSLTAPFTDIDQFLQDVVAVMAAPDEQASTLLGAHLEGPFINPDKLGAQPAHAIAVDTAQLQRWFATGAVRVLTYAPEMDKNNAVPELCRKYGVRAQMGHTLCTSQQAQQALNRGCGVTHLYNAMSGVSHRAAGAATAALAYAEYAEIITDGLHVEQAAFDAARRAINKLYSITDATAATGMPDGEYKLGEITVHKRNEQVQLADGTLAGSCLTQWRSMQVLRSWGIGWHELAALCSARPAAWISETSVGRIEAGSLAHWLEIRDNRLCAQWHAGSRTVLEES